MTPENAKAELAKRIKQSGTAMSALLPVQGIRLMLDFYKDVRTEDCEQERDGDMLLFQWGNHNWGKGFSFEFDVTRQFIRSQPEEDDDDQVDDAAISQLSLRFYFAPTAELGAIESSNRWCSTPDELAEFEAFIIGSDAYRAVQGLRPSNVTLSYGIAG